MNVLRKKNKEHWTSRSDKDFLFRIATDFMVQLEEKLESKEMNSDEYAELLNVSKGRISQILNYPSNLKLLSAIHYARVLGLKVCLLAYDDNDPQNRRGPINADVFRICWERQGKPLDFWAFEKNQGF